MKVLGSWGPEVLEPVLADGMVLANPGPVPAVRIA